MKKLMCLFALSLFLSACSTTYPTAAEEESVPPATSQPSDVTDTPAQSQDDIAQQQIRAFEQKQVEQYSYHGTEN